MGVKFAMKRHSFIETEYNKTKTPAENQRMYFFTQLLTG